jgi:hypothetical protein
LLSMKKKFVTNNYLPKCDRSRTNPSHVQKGEKGVSVSCLPLLL